jgi:hypothetical protein
MKSYESCNRLKINKMQVEVVQICEVVSEYCTGRVCDVELLVFKKKKVLRFCFFFFCWSPLP